MNSGSSTTVPTTNPTASSSFFSFSSFLNMLIFLFLLLLLIIGLIMMASGYEVIQVFFKTLQKIFEEHPLASEKSWSSALLPSTSKKDLEKEKEKEKEDSDSDSDSDSEMGPEEDMKIEKLETLDEPVPETEMANMDTNRTLDNAIETSIHNSTDTTTTVETFVPIDEEDISKDTTSWCFVGESKGSRGCAPMGKQDKCITGEVYVNQMECLKIHPVDAPKPPGAYDTYYRTK